jgi:hypothetical protein
MRFLIRLRCKAALWLLARKFGRRYALANLVCPSTTALVRASRRKPAPVPLPSVSHIFYHQASVEIECAENSLETVLWNVPPEDEVILYDKGGALPQRCFEALAGQQWRSWAAHRETAPEIASYTYGMNHSIPMAQAPVVVVWRSDYVYPRGLFAKYAAHIASHDIVLPYTVYIGAEHVRAGFVRANWGRLEPYDDAFWRANAAEAYSLYESQDPVLFAVRKKTWADLGGLDHRLWGYGWQFGEFAARLRSALPRSRVKYFDCAPPIHQNHASSLMVRTGGLDARKAEEDRLGRERFAAFLGGRDQFECYAYKWRQKLRPLPPDERR